MNTLFSSSEKLFPKIKINTNSMSTYKILSPDRVLIAIPANDRKLYCLKEFLEGLEKLVEYTTGKGYDVDVVFTDDTEGNNKLTDILEQEGYKVIKLNLTNDEKFSDDNEFRVKARNTLREYFLGTKFDFIFWLDADMITSEEIIVRFIQHDLDIVSGVYYTISNGRIIPLTFGHALEDRDYTKIPPNEPIPNKHLYIDKLIPSRLIDVVCAPFGNTLMKRKVMEDIPFRWWQGCLGDESVVWFFDAHKKGYKVYVDTHFHSKHMWEEI